MLLNDITLVDPNGLILNQWFRMIGFLENMVRFWSTGLFVNMVFFNDKVFFV